jgi:FkbM family methyltransferase
MIKKILKALGLYNFLLGQKRKLDAKKMKAEEKRNAAARVSFYKQILSPGDLVFDIGANIGNRVETFFNIGCNVVAVEPQEECIKILKQKFGDSIEIVEKGLGEKEEEKTIYISESNTLSSFSRDWIDSLKESRFKKEEWNRTAIVSLTTMDKLIEKYGIPAFCKIDVEGFELEVLKGLHQPVPYLSLEYAVPEQTKHLEAYINYCNSLNPGYKYNYSVKEEMKFQLPEFCSFDRFIRLIHEKEFQATMFGDIYVNLNQ